MSTLAEIEEAIASLPANQVEELAAWLHQRRSPKAMDTFYQADTTEQPRLSVRRFFGRFTSRNPSGADNDLIDGDLAAEAAGGLR